MYKKALILMGFLATTLLFPTVSAYSKAEFVKVIPVLEKNLGDAQSDFNDKCDNGLGKAYRKINSCFEDMCDKGENALSDSSTAIYNLTYIVGTISNEEDNDLLKRSNSFYVIADDSIIDTKKIISKIDYKQCTNNSYTTGDFGNPSTTTGNYSNTTSSNNNGTYSNNTVSSSNETTDSSVNEPVVNNDYTVATDYESTSSKAWYKPTTWFNDEQEQREVDNADDKDDIDSLKAQLHNIDDLEVTDPGDQVINSSDYDDDGYRPATADEKKAEKARIIAEINQKEVNISNRSSDIQRNTSALNEYSSNVSKAKSEAGDSLTKRNQLDTVESAIFDLESDIDDDSGYGGGMTMEQENALESLKAQQKKIKESFTAEDYKALTKVDAAQSELDRATELVDDGKVLKTQADREHEAIQQTARDAIKYNSENNISGTTKTSPGKTTGGKNTIPSSTNEKNGNVDIDLLANAEKNENSELIKARKKLIKIENQVADNEKIKVKANKNVDAIIKEKKDALQIKADNDKKKIVISPKEIGEYNKKIISNTNKICGEKGSTSVDCNKARIKQADDLKNAKSNIKTKKEKEIQLKADNAKNNVSNDLSTEVNNVNNNLENDLYVAKKRLITAENNIYKETSKNYKNKLEKYNQAKKTENSTCGINKKSAECISAKKIAKIKKTELEKATTTEVTSAMKKLAINNQLEVNREITKQNKEVNKAKQNLKDKEEALDKAKKNDKDCKSTACQKAESDVKNANETVDTAKKAKKTAVDEAEKTANKSKVDAAQAVLDNPESTPKDRANASKTLVNDSEKQLNEKQKALDEAKKNDKDCESNACKDAKKDVEKATKAKKDARVKAKAEKDAYLKTPEAKKDITTRVFTINVNDITPGMKVHGGDIEENVNFALGTIIQKLMIGLGSLSILIMTVGAGYIVLHNGQDELLNKGKSIFMSGIYAMIVSLSSYYLIVIVRYILYH